MHRLSLSEARKKLDQKEFSSVDLTEAVFYRIEKVEPLVHAYVTLFKDQAIQEAKSADKKIQSGISEPLLGLPIALKDLICLKNQKTTCASKILENFNPPYDATVATKLKEAGAVIVGKTNMDEFAMGSSNENSFFGETKNPWDLLRVPGGSSGGSAAAVSAGECLAALGSDTGGSIRQPAAFCGITGLKPTYGRVSRFGLVAFASSFDQIGPMTKTAEDAAILFDAIQGHDTLDSTSSIKTVESTSLGLDKPIEGMKIGIPKEYFVSGIDPEILKKTEDAIEVLKSLGVKMVDVNLPHTDYAMASYYILACAEASTNLSRYDGVRYGHRTSHDDSLMSMYTNTREEGFGEEVKRRILLGTFVLSAGYYDAYYLKAQKVRHLVKNDMDDAFSKCDAILAPVTPTASFSLGEKRQDPVEMYLSDVFTISANLAGVPALALPCGFSEGLPVGFQLMGPNFHEANLLRIGHAYQKQTDHHKSSPPLV